VDRVEVFWPVTGETQKIEGLEPRHRYHIREGTPGAREVDWPQSSRRRASAS
jgi:hypothetical protein